MLNYMDICVYALAIVLEIALVICYSLGTPIAPTWMKFGGRKAKSSGGSVNLQNPESSFGDPSLEDDPTMDEILQKGKQLHCCDVEEDDGINFMDYNSEPSFLFKIVIYLVYGISLSDDSDHQSQQISVEDDYENGEDDIIDSVYTGLAKKIDCVDCDSKVIDINHQQFSSEGMCPSTGITGETNNHRELVLYTEAKNQRFCSDLTFGDISPAMPVLQGGLYNKYKLQSNSFMNRAFNMSNCIRATL